MIVDRLVHMRGDERPQPDLFFSGTLEERIPENHPLRPVREMTDIALEALSARFDELYATNGWAAMPEQLLRALYLVRSERACWSATRIQPAVAGSSG